MDHAEAVRSKAAERYLLGEMTPSAREEYEEHFFGCVECAQDVQAGAVFVDAARDVLGSEGISAMPVKPERKPSLWTLILRPAFAIPAMALLLFVVGYQNLRTIPQMRSEVARSNSAQVPEMFSLLGANSRGGETLEVTVPRDREFGFYVDIPSSEQFSYYTLGIESDGGRTGLSSEVSAQEAKETVHFVAPPSRLSSGKYSLVVRGYDPQKSSTVDVVRYPFILKVSN
jgi:Putative zinc-finger